MLLLFSMLYLLFIMCVALVSFFIVTRLQAYSIHPNFTRPLTVVFIIITIFLVLLNIVLFFMIPFSKTLPSPSPYASNEINY